MDNSIENGFMNRYAWIRSAMRILILISASVNFAAIYVFLIKDTN